METTEQQDTTAERTGATPAWLADVESDEWLQLSELGINLVTPEENDLTRLDMLASDLLRRRAGVERALDGIRATQASERQMLEYRQQKARASLEYRAKMLDSDIERIAQIAESKGAFEKKAQSRKTTFGSYGRKRSSGGFVITDREAATVWAVENLPDFVRVKAKLSLHAALALQEEGVTEFTPKDCTVLVDAVYEACEAGAEVPGVAKEPASVTYYGKPTALESEEA